MSDSYAADRPDNWRDQAACARVGPDLWFPDCHDQPWTEERREDIEASKAICAACPVREPCLADAATFEAGKPISHRFGIWGGTTPQERLAADTTPARPATTPIEECTQPGTTRGVGRHATRTEPNCPTCAEFITRRAALRQAKLVRDAQIFALADRGLTPFAISQAMCIDTSTVRKTLTRRARQHRQEQTA